MSRRAIILIEAIFEEEFLFVYPPLPLPVSIFYPFRRPPASFISVVVRDFSRSQAPVTWFGWRQFDGGWRSTSVFAKKFIRRKRAPSAASIYSVFGVISVAQIQRKSCPIIRWSGRPSVWNQPSPCSAEKFREGMAKMVYWFDMYEYLLLYWLLN